MAHRDHGHQAAQLPPRLANQQPPRGVLRLARLAVTTMYLGSAASAASGGALLAGAHTRPLLIGSILAGLAGFVTGKASGVAPGDAFPLSETVRACLTRGGYAALTTGLIGTAASIVLARTGHPLPLAIPITAYSLGAMAFPTLMVAGGRRQDSRHRDDGPRGGSDGGGWPPRRLQPVPVRVRADQPGDRRLG